MKPKTKADPKMLGTGAAANAGKAIKQRQKKTKTTLQSVMHGLRSGRRK
jgi:hypothetical protein